MLQFLRYCDQNILVSIVKMKTKVLAVCTREDEPSTITVLRQEVALVEEFV